VSKVPEPELVGECTFEGAMQCSVPGKPDHVTSVCKDMLDSAVARLKDDPKLSIKLVGNRNVSENEVVAASRASNAKKYLEAGGVDSSRITVTTGTKGTRTTELWLVQ